MSTSRRIERAALVLLALGLVVDMWASRRTRAALLKLDERIDVLVQIHENQNQALQEPIRAPLPGEVFRSQQPPQGPGGSGAVAKAPPGGQPAAGRRANDQRRMRRVRGNTPAIQGADVLTRLYDAADRVAVEEDWSADRYDDVVFVFEDTTEQMRLLLEEVRAGGVPAQQVKREVVALRDDAQVQLEEILGPASFDRLRSYVAEAEGSRR